MVVIMILGLLVGIVGVSLFDSASQATVDATKTQIRGLETALDLYRLHNGRYPTTCLLYTSPSPRDKRQSRMPSSA